MPAEENRQPIESYPAYLETLPKKRMAAGAIIRDANQRILMVQPSYKEVWEVPGGVVEKDESPYAACIREVQEETGLEVIIERLLCVDYNSSSGEDTESLIFLFHGRDLQPEAIKNIQVDGQEILSYSFMSLEEIKGKARPSLYRSIEKSVKALEERETFYLEDQSLI